MGANPEVVRKFFDQLEQVLSDLNIVNPEQIWNCDESGCSRTGGTSTKGAKCQTPGASTVQWGSWSGPPQRAGLTGTYFLNIQLDG